MLWSLLITVAFAGYGDAVDGRPNRMEREVHLWTNAVRISPDSFRADFGGDKHNCYAEFLPEQTVPHAPLAWHDGLGEIARLHSADMDAFDDVDAGPAGSAMSHTSSDGTGFADRVKPYYEGHALGENVAWGFKDGFGVVMAWMCSEGHRENLMRTTYVEMGVGQVDTYWTQDFGGRDLAPRVLNMGTHLEAEPVDEVTLAVDAWQATQPVIAVLDGVNYGMQLSDGVAGSGLYNAALPVNAGCHYYWFTSGQERFPEEGAYGFGDCAFDDAEAGWSGPDTVLAAVPSADLNGDGVRDSDQLAMGCDVAGGHAGWVALVGLLALRRRRGLNLPAMT